MTSDNKIPNNRFFKDDKGQIVIWQWPNIPLYGWIVFKLLSLLFNDQQFRVGFNHISSAFLFTWAFLELTQGVNYFRKLIGLVVLAVLLIGYLKLQ